MQVKKFSRDDGQNFTAHFDFSHNKEEGSAVIKVCGLSGMLRQQMGIVVARRPVFSGRDAVRALTMLKNTKISFSVDPNMPFGEESGVWEDLLAASVFPQGEIGGLANNSFLSAAQRQKAQAGGRLAWPTGARPLVEGFELIENIADSLRPLKISPGKSFKRRFLS